MQRDIRFGDRLLERIKVHHDEIDRADAVLADGRFVRRVAADVEQPAVNFRMQRFDAAVEHLRKPGVVAEILNTKSRSAQRLGRAAGGNEFDARLREGLGKRDETGFVGDG